ncbi:Branched-chain amino acid ABC transporter substrate-binding protein [Methylocella tundrae]|uniref:Branched-chain amino acid ABC transporter substrate-binding protein n=1 Tax=Methylocella tundrae TaxID=227605 RepID=A0A8B6M1G8_METTU|nr:ABC transporter substrate-binding protein [Methylocella tundrae]WPP06143.1 ABC transporter substrate-binding protein [Methylocella tundrae]VTZ27746.1 Branched-chain amino acid ABC transporter substrate-binding protein [Methylocella tundrae]VTZ48678.1 Branched-chain amino acid ABC transporter substrate-binding protein [Methylocella tundrae]
MVRKINRREVVLSAAAGAAATIFPAPYISKGFALDSKPIVLGVPTSQTAAAGVADDLDHLNGTTLAMEEINAAGGILGRPLKLFVTDVDKLSPESCQQAIAACVDAKVDAISNAFLFVPIPAMDASAKYKCPYLQGNTQRAATEAFKANPTKYSHIFQTDPSEVHYGYTYPVWLKAMEDSGAWKPKNRKVHIVQEQVAYCQTISKAAQQALKNSNFELAAVTDIQFPVQDWSPVIEKLKQTDAGAIMIDHWVAAEYAAFCKQFVADPVKDSLVYLQYGPSQPEFLTLAGEAANGFCWSTVLGVYADERGNAFRAKYKKRFPGVMGLVYTGNGYDIAHYLKAAWEATGDPSNFKAVCDWVRANPYRGVCGYMDMRNEYQEAAHYPDDGHPVSASELEKGMSQLYVQVQNAEHKIIYPYDIKQSKLQPAPWWG